MKKRYYFVWLIAASLGMFALGGYFIAEGLSSRYRTFPAFGGMYFLGGIGGIIIGFIFLVFLVPHYFRTEIKPSHIAEDKTDKKHIEDTEKHAGRSTDLSSYWVNTDLSGKKRHKTPPWINFPWGRAPGGLPLETEVVFDKPKDKKAFYSLTKDLKELGGKIEEVGVEIPQNKQGEPKGFSVSSNGEARPVYDLGSVLYEDMNKTGTVSISLSLDSTKVNSVQNLSHVTDVEKREVPY